MKIQKKNLCWVLVGWSLFLLVFSVKTLIDPVKASVYPAFSGGARDLWAGRPLYGNLGFYYSPTFAVAVSPFAALPDRCGGILWVAASMALLWYSLRRVFHDIVNSPALAQRVGALSPGAEAAFLALAGFGNLRGLWSAQSNALLLAMVLLATSAIVRKQWWLAAELLAAPVYIKVWPLAVAGLLIVQWPRQLAPRFVAAMISLAVVPFLFNGPTATIEIYRSWFDCLVERQNDGVRWGGYRDVYTIWEQIQTPVSRHGYMLLQLAGGVAALGWCLRQLYLGRSTRQRLLYTVAAWSACQLLLGPGTERLTYGLIAPAMAWAIVSSYHRRAEAAWRTVCCLATTAYVVVYLVGAGHLERLVKPYTTWVMTLEPLGIMLFAACLARYAQLAKNQSDDEAHPATSSLPRQPTPQKWPLRAA